MSRGVTLSELALVLVVLGVLAGAAMPAGLRLRDGIAVEGAARAVAAAHARARIAAVALHRPVLLEVRAESLSLRRLGAAGDTASLWLGAGPAADGVRLEGGGRALRFAPDGWAQGVANARYVLTRGRARRAVVVSRLGRVRIEP